MSNILAIRVSAGNRLHFFRSEPYVVSVGDHVLIQVEGELHMGKVERVTPLAVFEGKSSPNLPYVASRDASKVIYSEISSADPSDESSAPLPDVSVDPLPFTSDEVRNDDVVSEARFSMYDIAAIFRPATEEDLIRDRENRELARNAHVYCRECIGVRVLDMKLVDVEVLFDGSKIIFYFTAPNRIDFRELVKDLVRAYRTRIELRQIGARHETQMLGGLGNCGQLVCCQRFLRQFAPSTIKMAKEQNLFLNPAKISGVCNRLLCCLSYEQPNYDEFLNQCPKIGKRYSTALGSAKVIRANYFRRTVSIFLEPGGEREIDLDEWKRLISTPRDPGQPSRGEPIPPKAGGKGTASAATPTSTPATVIPVEPANQVASKPVSEAQPAKKSKKTGPAASRQENPAVNAPGKSKRRSRSSRRKSKKQSTATDKS